MHLSAVSGRGWLWKEGRTVEPAWWLPHSCISRHTHFGADWIWTKELEMYSFKPVLVTYPWRRLCMFQGYMNPQFLDHCPAALDIEVITNFLASVCRTELSQWPSSPLSLAPCRYEVEINRRTAAENEFVVLKKVRRTTGQVEAERAP